MWEHGLARGAAAGIRRAGRSSAHADAHYSVARAAGILGLGSRQIVRVGLDERGRMDPRRLDEELTRLRARNQPIVAVVACACATPIGAFDPLDDIADVCRRHGVWLHVDAAHGGAAVLSDRHRHLVAGLERADSVVWDAHKMLFVPGLCAFVLYRDKAHRFEAFRQDAPYLFDPAAPGLAEYDSGMKTVECTKRAAAFGLWGVWSLFGRQLFADMVDVTFALGRTFYEKLAAADDFVPLHEPAVQHRGLPARAGRAARRSARTRRATSSSSCAAASSNRATSTSCPSKRDGIGALRVTIINPLTTPAHLDRLMDALRRHGRDCSRVDSAERHACLRVERPRSEPEGGTRQKKGEPVGSPFATDVLPVLLHVLAAVHVVSVQQFVALVAARPVGEEFLVHLRDRRVLVRLADGERRGLRRRWPWRAPPGSPCWWGWAGRRRRGNRPGRP